MSAPRRRFLALAFLPLAGAAADEPPPPPAMPLEMFEFLAEEPAGVDGMEEALMSQEIDRAMASVKVKAPRKPTEGDDDES